MSKPVRVLHVVRKMDMGGVQSVIMNYYRTIDREKIQFDFVTKESGKGIFDNEIESLGGIIHRPKHDCGLFRWIIHLFWVLYRSEYQIVHAHQNFANVYSLTVALLKGIPVRISHSHNAYPERSVVKNLLKKLASVLINRISTQRLACSFTAGKWLYGERQVTASKVKILANAIDVEKFRYSQELHDLKKSRLGLSTKFVFGHVGNFGLQKNHAFLIDIFFNILKKKRDAHLVLVGDGELQEIIRQRTVSYGIHDSITFLGKRDDVHELMQSFDFLLFPSLYEGFPVVLIEAQASGLSALVSDAVTAEVKITRFLNFMSLEKTAEEWANVVVQTKSNTDRQFAADLVKVKGFDLFSVIAELEAIYLEPIGNTVQKVVIQ